MSTSGETRGSKVGDAGAASFVGMTPEQATKRIKKLEQQMQKHARNLEFEVAAKLRDEILALRKVELGLPSR